jgi:hypothetical protein
MEQIWKIQKYTILDLFGENSTGNLKYHTITITNNDTDEIINFEVEAVGLFTEILQIIVYLYDFEKTHEYYNYFIENGFSDGRTYHKTIEQSKKIKDFLSKSWIENIKAYLKLS